MRLSGKRRYMRSYDAAKLAAAWDIPLCRGRVANTAEHRHQRSWADLCVLQGQLIPVVPVKISFERSSVAGSKPMSVAPFSKHTVQAVSRLLCRANGKCDKLFIKKITAYNLYKQYTWRWLRMENIKSISENTAKTTVPNEKYAKTKAYQDFINVLSQIIEKHGAEVLAEINRAK